MSFEVTLTDSGDQKFQFERVHPAFVDSCGRKIKYQMLGDFSIQTSITAWVDVDLEFLSMTRAGVLTVKKGWGWDGASGPARDSMTFMIGSCIHDALYWLIRNKYLQRKVRKDADRLLRMICRSEGMNKFRAAKVYNFVRWFAKRSSKPRGGKA
jgi:hypothetical protein